MASNVHCTFKLSDKNLSHVTVDKDRQTPEKTEKI